MADKVTIMVLKVVDLHCCSCYKKIKKVLCKFPEIRNQVFDEKANTVTITVVCCNPERIRDKLYCKGGKTITSIEIKPPPPPPPSQNSKPKPPPSPECKCKPEKPPSECKCKPPPPHECKCKPEKPPSECKCKPPPPPPPALVVCCRQCSEGHSGGPCYQLYGRPVPFYDGYGYGYCEKKICYASRCDYFNEEYTSGCTVM